MTLFHGIPLNIIKKGHWRNWKNWIYAPSIPATRCEKCKIVFLTYDNEEKENPKKERISSAIIGALFF